jgi:hypothetical protein
MDEDTKNKIRDENEKIKLELETIADKIAINLATIKFRLMGAPVWRCLK